MFINDKLIMLSKGSRKEILSTGLLELIITAVSTLIAFCSSVVIIMLTSRKSMLLFNSPIEAIAVSVIFIIIRYYLSGLKAVYAGKASIVIKNNLRENLLHKIFSLGPAFTGKKRTGELTSSISSKVDWLNNYYTIYLPAALSSTINAAVIIAILAVNDLHSALICGGSVLGMLFCPMIFYKSMKKRGDKEWKAESEYYSECLDGIQGIVSLKSFNANGIYRKRIHDKGEELRRSVMAQLKITMLENGTLEFFARLGSAVSVGVVALRFNTGDFNINFLVYSLFLIGACFAPMLTLISAWHIGYKGVTASSGIFQLLKEEVTYSFKIDKIYEKDYSSCCSSELSNTPNADICFENVYFSYNKDEETLHDVSFKLPSCKTLALVGASGSGKSTIAQLAAGFYSPGRGRIKIGGIELSEKSVYDVQKLVSAVWQDSHIFCTSVYENIALGKKDASEDEVIEAAKSANIHELIKSLPEGYNTVLGERGMRFSGGEKQRIAIARAFLKKSPILILDEATSALDRNNEIQIQESLKKLTIGKTVLMIAHRIETIENADFVCVIDKGKIVEFGNHKSLKDSKYYKKIMGHQIVMGGI